MAAAMDVRSCDDAAALLCGSKGGGTELLLDGIMELEHDRGAACSICWYLNLKFNVLSTVQPSFGALTGLTKLDLEDNRLHRLPIELGQMTIKSAHIEVDAVVWCAQPHEINFSSSLLFSRMRIFIIF
jgi:hypothetical protein